MEPTKSAAIAGLLPPETPRRIGAIPDYDLDQKGLPVPRVDRRRLACRDAREVRPRDIGLQALVSALHGLRATSELLGVTPWLVRDIAVGRALIPLSMIDRLIELARERSAALAALAVRLETVDRPVLLERRRIVRERARERFRKRFGYFPEENQVMKRQRPPG